MLRRAVFTNATEGYDEKTVESEIAALLEKECYKILMEIKAVLEDDSLDDKDCFEKIENIVSIFENAGIGCGTRHDFG